MDSEEVAPSAGLSVRVETLTSSPDGNTIRIRYIRPDNDETLPCVHYIHGGRMEMSSCFEGNYKTWGRMIAANGVAVAMVEFRNSVHPSAVPDPQLLQFMLTGALVEGVPLATFSCSVFVPVSRFQSVRFDCSRTICRSGNRHRVA
jgi:hypothetical protein